MKFSCEHCGHEFEVDDSLAGKHGHCKLCGQKMTIPAAASRQRPVKEAVASDPMMLAPIHEEHVEPGNIPEEFLADRAPYELDADFEPPPSAVSPPSNPMLMEARAGWRHQVRKLLEVLAGFEDVIYLVLMVFWFVGAGAFLFELKPLAWSMLIGLIVCSVLLLLLGGVELFAFPFRESLRHGLAFVFLPPYAMYYIATRWTEMKRPFKKALGAFMPLLILLGLAYFSRPIRDWYLHAPPKKDKEGQQAFHRAGPDGPPFVRVVSRV